MRGNSNGLDQFQRLSAQVFCCHGVRNVHATKRLILLPCVISTVRTSVASSSSRASYSSGSVVFLEISTVNHKQLLRFSALSSAIRTTKDSSPPSHHNSLC